MSEFKRAAIPLALVRFESARGMGGVPKVWLVLNCTDTAMLIQEAVALLRIRCELPGAHGRDLMPSVESPHEYLLHNADGGVLNALTDIVWEHDSNGQPTRAELVLTWGAPSMRLAAETKGTPS